MMVLVYCHSSAIAVPVDRRIYSRAVLGPLGVAVHVH
ncbi:unannotated protein [freshwater metagenome]|uniref:Unannotated protein n=1 Tax=freshwater metagenome TaxID=449393 RepID=A0A6J6Q773_9ZZZZ